VLFTDAARATAEPYVVREELIQEAVLLAGVEVSVTGLLPQGYYSGSGGGISGLTVAASGPNYDDLETLCERFAQRVKRASRRVARVNTNAARYGRQTSREVLRLRYEAKAQARTGVSPRRLAARLRPVLATRFPALHADVDGRPHMPVRLTVAGADTLDVRTLVDLPLLMGDSSRVKLKSAASHAVEAVPGRIVRENQQYTRYVQVDYRLERAQPGFFTDEVRTIFGGVVLATVGLVFLATAAIFESWRLPLVVLLSVPTAAVGVAAGFWWADVPFAEGAFIGTVLLVGIAANDSILLVDRYRQLRRQRPHGRSGTLVRLAVRERLRPMWTTTLSTCVAMLPLLVFPQNGDFWTGLAVTVTGGLVAATLLAPPVSVALLSLMTAAPSARTRPARE
jgi:multidrug efflux pump subunit AcrB